MFGHVCLVILQVLFMVCVVLLGSTVNATIFANVASLVTQITAASAGHQRKMDNVAIAMRSLKMPTGHVEGHVPPMCGLIIGGVSPTYDT